MTKSVFFLDNDFLINIYGEVEGDADRLVRALDALYDKYDVRITDRVYNEATNSGNPTFPKDIAVDNWLNSKNIIQIITNVSEGNNVGERSIIYAIENPGSDPVLSDWSTPIIESMV